MTSTPFGLLVLNNTEIRRIDVFVSNWSVVSDNELVMGTPMAWQRVETTRLASKLSAMNKPTAARFCLDFVSHRASLRCITLALRGCATMPRQISRIDHKSLLK